MACRELAAQLGLHAFEFTNVADTIQMDVKEVQTLVKQQQDDVKERNRQIEDGVFAAIADPRRPVQSPKIEPVAPALNFAPLENAVTGLTRAAERYKKAAEAARLRLDGNGAGVGPINARLIQSERQFVEETGLPRRSWYRNLLYAPGYYTGYSVKTLPGIREAIEQKAYADAEAEVARVARAIDRETALLDAVSSDLEKLK